MKRKSCLTSAVCVGLLIVASPTLPQATESSTDVFTINYIDSDVKVVATMIADEMNKPVVVDPDVRKKVTWRTRQPVSRPDLYSEFTRVLAEHGLSAQESDGVIRIVYANSSK